MFLRKEDLKKSGEFNWTIQVSVCAEVESLFIIAPITMEILKVFRWS